MDFYRCENPDCGFVAEEEPDVCPRCGGTFFTAVTEEEMTASDWVNLGNQAVDEKRETDALAAYQRRPALRPRRTPGSGPAPSGRRDSPARRRTDTTWRPPPRRPPRRCPGGRPRPGGTGPGGSPAPRLSAGGGAERPPGPDEPGLVPGSGRWRAPRCLKLGKVSSWTP